MSESVRGGPLPPLRAGVSGGANRFPRARRLHILRRHDGHPSLRGRARRSSKRHPAERSPCSAVTKFPALYAQLAKAGYTADDHQEGWRLLLAAAGFTPTAAPPPRAPSPAFDAMAELDALDEDVFARARAALERLHPSAFAFVFAGGLAASQGPGAVVGMGVFLDRLDALEHGKGREKSEHKGDLAALATLEKRGLTKAERKRLHALVDAAKDLGDAPAPPPAPAPTHDDLRALYAWYKDWSTTARSVIKKRASLISLGLAKRIARKSPADDGSGGGGGGPPGPPAPSS
ncbi:MAG TPA: hypothetical protein VHB21_23100 [Minicystis sp.]|nr:hypothetical protein [Minicystis sp.]